MIFFLQFTMKKLKVSGHTKWKMSKTKIMTYTRGYTPKARILEELTLFCTSVQLFGGSWSKVIKNFSKFTVSICLQTILVVNLVPHFKSTVCDYASLVQ